MHVGVMIPRDVLVRVVAAAAGRNWSIATWVREAVLKQMEDEEARSPLTSPMYRLPDIVMVLAPNSRSKYVAGKMYTDDVARLDQYAWRAGQSRAAWMRAAILAALAREEAP